eukprot:6073799-Pleurochrysis_carterae.AAC.1
MSYAKSTVECKFVGVTVLKYALFTCWCIGHVFLLILLRHQTRVGYAPKVKAIGPRAFIHQELNIEPQIA